MDFVSCYQLVDTYEQGTIVEDVWSGERYRMPYCETMVKLSPWSVAVGMIEPYIEDWCIHGVFMWSHPDVKSEVMARVRQLQEEIAQGSGRKLPPADILADNYPEIINLCHRTNQSRDGSVKNPKDMRELLYIRREYSCEESKLALTVGLVRVDERSESHQIPKEVLINRYNIITDKKLSEQEVIALSNFPKLLQSIRKEQEKFPRESIEMLVRRKEYEQYRVNPDMSALNFLRAALGLPESPFA